MKKLNSKETYSEIYVILNILGEDFINKIPSKLYSLIESQKNSNYIPNLLLDNGTLDESKISQETIALFAVLNQKYFIQDEEEKKELLKIYEQNEIQYQKELHEKYNPSKIFANSKPELEINSNLSIIEVKDSIGDFYGRFRKEIKSNVYK